MAYITIDTDKCKGCGICADNCSRKLIVFTDERMNALGYRPAVYVDPDGQCLGCKICAEMCPDICIEVYK